MTKLKEFKPILMLAVGLTLLMMNDPTISTIGIVLFILAISDINDTL